MGKMKEIFMQMVEHEYNGDHDAYVQDMARQSCEEFVHVPEEDCGNCDTPVIVRNENTAVCEACGIQYIYVEGTKRFL